MTMTEGTETRSGGWTGVVYFHGIGNQRRYEEVSKLIDRFDLYANACFRERGDKVGLIKGIHARSEPAITGRPGETSFVGLVHSVRDEQGEWHNRNYRFYEAYWAPLTAGVTSARSVQWWLFRQLAAPFRVTVILSPTLWSSPALVVGAGGVSVGTSGVSVFAPEKVLGSKLGGSGLFSMVISMIS